MGLVHSISLLFLLRKSWGAKMGTYL
jgi:hypothetical protein